VVMLFSLNLCYNRTNTIIEEYEDVWFERVKINYETIKIEQ
jgi:hypothetical protein